jgi:hypothetical protein
MVEKLCGLRSPIRCQVQNPAIRLSLTMPGLPNKLRYFCSLDHAWIWIKNLADTERKEPLKTRAMILEERAQKRRLRASIRYLEKKSGSKPGAF